MKKKVLVLCPRFPYPVVGGDRLRIYQVCKELSKSFELTLVSFCETKEEMEQDVSEDGIFTFVDRVYLPRWQSYLNCLGALFSTVPLQVAYYRSREFSRIVRKYEGIVDICLVHLIRMAPYALSFSVPKILEMTDAISMNYERLQGASGKVEFRSLVYAYEKKRLKKYEQSIIEKFDSSVLVSEVDRDYLFGKAIGVSTLVCSNGVDTNSLDYCFDPVDLTLVFIGNMTSVQNFDAAMWFATEVMPLLLKVGEFKFKVVGKISDQHMVEFNRLNGVTCTGRVDRVQEHIEGALAGICSVRIGAGVQNKILEYMAFGLPAIVSVVGSEGIAASEEHGLLVANTPEDYVREVLRLVGNVEFAKSVSLAGRNYVKRHHSWEEILGPYVNEFLRLSMKNVKLNEGMYSEE